MILRFYLVPKGLLTAETSEEAIDLVENTIVLYKVSPFTILKLSHNTHDRAPQKGNCLSFCYQIKSFVVVVSYFTDFIDNCSSASV